MAELKAQLYLLEKEKKALELKLSTREAQEQAYLVHIEHLKSEVEEQKEQRTRSLSSTSSGGKDAAGKVGRGPGSASPPAEPEAGKVGREPGSASPPAEPEAGKVGRGPCSASPPAEPHSHCPQLPYLQSNCSHPRDLKDSDILSAKKPSPHFFKPHFL